ncbi:hypothetical protein [Lysobacter enzymogenes]|uniref:hypothetical protein n=1 Tax=Lysobacter enzymogenes TaxID=69 RepID=UPI002263C739|nr:hypothetical protein [Lysobacter enzymogenes]UZW61167.1 hypothetical protein BV903_002405 [Lysobacter enzymogenes]
MDIGLLQFVEKGASETDGAVLVGLISGLAGAFAAALVGILSYFGVQQSAKSQLSAAKLMAETQQNAAKFASDGQVEVAQVYANLEYRKLHVAQVTAERLRWLQDLRIRVAQMFRDIEEQVGLARRPRSLIKDEHEAIQKNWMNFPLACLLR